MYLFSAASRADFPCAQPSPIPVAFVSSTKFANLNDEAAVAAFRDRQLGRRVGWADKLQADSGRSSSFTLDSLRPATGKPHAALCAQSSHMLGLYSH